MRTRIMTTLAIVAILLSTAHVLAQVPNFQRGQVLKADELNRVVDQVNRNTDALSRQAALRAAELERIEAQVHRNTDALSRDGSVTHAVTCPSESIAEAMSRARAGDTITILGTCNENVVVDKDGITLDGRGAAVINAAGAYAAAIDITGHQNVAIRGLTVQNGRYGILLNLGAAATLEDVTARNNRAEGDGSAGVGIRVQNSSSVAFAGTIVAEENGTGIVVTRNSSLGINAREGGTIHAIDNTRFGIGIYYASSMVLHETNLEVTGNDWGLVLTGSTCEFSDGSAILDDNRVGMSFDGNSTCNFYDNSASAANNLERGLQISEGAQVYFDDDSPLTINNNGRGGIGVYSMGNFQAFGPLEVMDNATRGLEAWTNSFLELKDATISGNNYGILIGDGSVLYLDSSTVTGNDTADIFAGRGSIVGWFDSRVGTVDCAVSALVKQDAACP